MIIDRVLAQKIKTARMKLLTARDSAYVAQYEHYIVSNSCLFCLGETGSCDIPPGSGKARRSGRVSNGPGGKALR